ncbi:MAG: RIP metalloprotease RseP, partial [Pseudomonadales bacterium]|nr:RIP metalloprotease RseP [Pseudomonadales bacterium]
GEKVRTWSEGNQRLFKRIGDTGEIKIEARLPGSYDANSRHTIAIENWLSGADNPYPPGDLGLHLKYPEIPAVIGQVIEGEPAEAAGLQTGDRIQQVNGEFVEDWGHWVDIIQAHPGETMRVEVLRDGEARSLEVVPRVEQRDGGTIGYIGAARESVEFPEEMQRVVSWPIYSAWIPALERTWSVTVFTLESIGKMIVGAISTKNLSGPITIAQVANATAQSGLESFIGFIALLSISLGVLNLLPIPVLDGGHLLYYLVELIAGRPVPERVQVWGLQLGMFIIISIMLLAFYNDLMRL